MITLLFADKLPEEWEPGSIWLLAGAEGLLLDAPLLSIILGFIRSLA
jgi:hypothetical protein